MKVLILAAVVSQFSAIACHTQSNGANGTGSSPESAPLRSIHLPVGTHPDGLSIADVNNYGNVDILVASEGSGSLSVYLGDWKGAFSQADRSPFSAGQDPTDMTTGDFNGDGNLDVAI